MSKKTAEIEKKLSSDAIKILKQDPKIIAGERDTRRKYYPSKNFIPNIAQEKATACYRHIHPEYQDFPKKMFFFGGNGVGKTAEAAAGLLAGVTLGKNFVDLQYHNYDYFDYCEEIRRKRPFLLRIVCDQADMKTSGSIYQQIKKWIPTAIFKGRTSGQYYLEIIIPSPNPDQFKTTVIDIKTHDMKVTSHAGPDYDLIIYNEPPPGDIYAENEGRTRIKGRAAAFLTPLDEAEYMQKIIDGDHPEGEVYHTRASIWDNCMDIPGTRGILSRRDIESMMRTWMAIDPLQVPARESGQFMHLVGAVFKIFNEEYHVIDPIPIERDWMIIQVVDHHPHKPACSVWLAWTPQNIVYIIAEYPTEPWDQLTGTTLTIRNFGRDFKLIEQGMNPQFQYLRPGITVNERIGDPNAFKAQLANTRCTVQRQYELDCQLWYNIENVDNDIDLRHNQIKQLLFYDFQRKVDSVNCPQMYVFRPCKNVKRAFRNYTAKKDKKLGTIQFGKYEQTWKDWIDCIGYGVTTFTSWEPHSPHTQGTDDYLEICKGRDPRYSGNNNSIIDPHIIDIGMNYEYSGNK